jgi:glycosyltransferase involved in cell wall biosynthesis
MHNQVFDVSVIIPTYNRANSIIKAIQSVLNQTLPSFEIIVIDDGSTDNTYEIINASFGSKITYLHQQNAGVSAARNQGIQIAKGNWIAFLDSDDIWREDKLKNDYHQLKSAIKEVDFIHGNRAQQWTNGKYEEGRDHHYIDDFCNKRFLLSTWTIKTSTVVIKKKLLAKLDSNFNLSLKTCEDYEFFWRAIISSNQIVYAEKPNVSIQITDDSLSRKTNEITKIEDNISAIYCAKLWAKKQHLPQLEQILQIRLRNEFTRRLVMVRRTKGILTMLAILLKRNNKISNAEKLNCFINYLKKVFHD